MQRKRDCIGDRKNWYPSGHHALRYPVLNPERSKQAGALPAFSTSIPIRFHRWSDGTERATMQAESPISGDWKAYQPYRKARFVPSKVARVKA